MIASKDFLYDPLMGHLGDEPAKSYPVSHEPGSLDWWGQVVEISRLQEIQDLFAKIMKVGAIMTTTDGVPVTQPSNFSDFCLAIRTFPEGRAKCYKSDATGGARALKAGRTVLYRCPHGLLDMAGPIVVEGRMVGVMLCGQVSLQQQTPEQASKVADNYWIAPSEEIPRLMELFIDTSVADRRSIRRSMEFLHLVTSHIVGLCERQITELQLMQRSLSLINEQRNKENLKRHLKITQVKALRSQLNPHFMFNTLNVISRLAFFENAPKTQDLTVQFAEYLRYVLHQQSCGELVSLNMEIESVKRYLTIYQVRFGDRLRTAIDTDPTCEQELVPFMILQPLVENAVEHGIEPMPQGGEVSVRSHIDGGKLVIAVSDNGVGFHPDYTKFGIGLDNVTERLRLHYGDDAALLIDSAPQNGATVKIVIPCKR